MSGNPENSSGRGSGAQAAAPTGTGRVFTGRRLVPLAVLLGGLEGFFALGLDEYAHVEALRAHRQELIDPKIEDHGGRPPRKPSGSTRAMCRPRSS